MASHPSRKNKDAARVGHPIIFDGNRGPNALVLRRLHLEVAGDGEGLDVDDANDLALIVERAGVGKVDGSALVIGVELIGDLATVISTGDFDLAIV